MEHLNACGRKPNNQQQFVWNCLNSKNQVICINICYSYELISVYLLCRFYIWKAANRKSVRSVYRIYPLENKENGDKDMIIRTHQVQFMHEYSCGTLVLLSSAIRPYYWCDRVKNVSNRNQYSKRINKWITATPSGPSALNESVQRNQIDPLKGSECSADGNNMNNVQIGTCSQLCE